MPMSPENQCKWAEQAGNGTAGEDRNCGELKAFAPPQCLCTSSAWSCLLPDLCRAAFCSFETPSNSPLPCSVFPHGICLEALKGLCLFAYVFSVLFISLKYSRHSINKALNEIKEQTKQLIQMFHQTKFVISCSKRLRLRCSFCSVRGQFQRNIDS